MTSDSTVVRRGRCDECGADRAKHWYSDGHTYCFSCQRFVLGVKVMAKLTELSRLDDEVNRSEPLLSKLYFDDIPERQLREETCRKYGYYLKRSKNGVIHVEQYVDASGTPVAQHIRTPDKRFMWRGDYKRAGLFGQHLFNPRPDSNIFLTITEGAIDTLAAAQVTGLKFPIVSVKSGADGAARDVAEQIEWIEQFPFVVFCFDQDEPGRKAALACAQLLSPGKAKIAALPLKDADEMHRAKRGKELVSALFEAREYRPDGVINGADILDELKREPARALVPFPWPKVQGMIGGYWPGTVMMLAAGTNAGKTPLVYNMIYHLLSSGETVGTLHTEQQHREAALGIIQMELQQRLDPRLLQGFQDGFDEAFFKTVGSGRWHYFSVDLGPKELLSKAKYLIQARKCGWIFVDHLTDIVNQFAGEDERRFIDNMMAEFKALAVRHRVGLILVSQLTRPQGNKGHEHGLQVAMHQLRGSGSLGSVPAVILGYERNLQDEENSRIGHLRVLKNRHGGKTGAADMLFYDGESGRLSVIDNEGVLLDGQFRDESAGSSQSDF